MIQMFDDYLHWLCVCCNNISSISSISSSSSSSYILSINQSNNRRDTELASRAKLSRRYEQKEAARRSREWKKRGVWQDKMPMLSLMPSVSQ